MREILFWLIHISKIIPWSLFKMELIHHEYDNTDKENMGAFPN